MKVNLYSRGALGAIVMVAVGMAMAMAMAMAPAVASAADLATAVTHGGGIQLLPNVGYERAIVRVAGNGHEIMREFAKGGFPSIDLFDAEGHLLPDGVYRWQLDVVPLEADAKRLREDAAKGLVSNTFQPQSGVFVIRNGTIADPRLVEPEPVRSGFSTDGQELSGAGERTETASARDRELMDSDSAVASGTIESGAASTLDEAPAAKAADDRAAALRADADGAAAVDHLARTESPQENASSLRPQPKPADGSNGRTPGSTPNR